MAQHHGTDTRGMEPRLLREQAKILTAKDVDMTQKTLSDMEVTKHMIVDGTLTSTPMNSTLHSSFRMGTKADMANVIVHDMIGMSYDVAKAVLRGDTGSEDQRERLRVYVAEFDKAVAAGTDRFEAAMAARAIALA